MRARPNHPPNTGWVLIFKADTLSRLIYGTRTVLLVGFVTVGVAATSGVILGITAGYYGGATNVIIMRIMDALMGFPMLLLALLIAAILGGGIQNVIIALCVATIPGYCRVICGMTLAIRENDYILAQKALGSHDRRIIFQHILPNSLPPMIVLITLQLVSDIGVKPASAFWVSASNRRAPPGEPWSATAMDTC
jgi:ABC-type dipeptide/oligopeptide/nickel transport system permease subunit